MSYEVISSKTDIWDIQMLEYREDIFGKASSVYFCFLFLCKMIKVFTEKQTVNKICHPK